MFKILWVCCAKCKIDFFSCNLFRKIFSGKMQTQFNPYFCNRLRAYNKHIAIFLLIVISVFIIPKELVHAFYGHNDTVHAVSHSENGLPAIEKEHQHCDILNFNAPLYFLSLSFFKSYEKPVALYNSENCKSLFLSPAFRLFSFRGPPAL